MGDTGDFGTPRDEAERERLGEIVAHSFGTPIADTKGWFEAAGHDNLRVLRRGGRVDAGLIVLPMGQWFGGRPVPMHGIIGVGVAAEARGRGVARLLMDETVREIHARGAALSALYPATETLYRRSGYELAGSRWETQLPLDGVGLAERGLEVRPIGESDAPVVEALWRTFAARGAGQLDRPAYVWRRVRSPRIGGPARGWIVEGPGGPEGYVYFVQRPKENFHFDLAVTDLVDLTPRAARRLLTLLSEFRTIGDTALFHGAVPRPLLMQLPEGTAKVRRANQWMVRIADVAGALQARGWPRGVRGTLQLDVRDDLLPACNGRFVLEVEDGAAHVARGGDGTFRLDVRGLAPLYTGYLGPHALQDAGHVEAGDADLAVAAQLFASPAPAMADSF